MALTLELIEYLAEWCTKNEAIADIRARARSEFFGYDDPEPVNYMAGADDIKSQERRFLGWFVFYYKLSDGRHPGELAASALLKEPELSLALKAIREARYITAVVTSIVPGRCVFLKLEDEDFEVTSRMMSCVVEREQTVSLNILPVGRGRWVHGPGWITWPIRFGPGIRSNLKNLQTSPIEVERFLQQRGGEEKEALKHETFDDDTLEAAVARMSEAAKKAGREKLILPVNTWKKVVAPFIMNNDFEGMVSFVAKRAGGFKDINDANSWLALAQNIWNNTPQPDRWGKSAHELSQQVQKETKNRGQDEDYEIQRMAANITRELREEVESSWRQDIESRKLLVDSRLQASLNKLPANWIDAVCVCLRLQAVKTKKEKIAGLLKHLGESKSLSRTVLSLPPQHMEALAYILDSGGWVKYGQLSRKFGDETGDSWWWLEEPPQSIIGQLRLRGLLFVGQAPVGSRMYKVAVIPADLREPLQRAMSLASGKSQALRIPDTSVYKTLGERLSEIKLCYATFATESEQLRAYYRELMAYWNVSGHAQSKADGFILEHYLWNFRLPGTDKFLLDYYLEQKRGEVPGELISNMLNWRGAGLKCCQVIEVKDLILLEDIENGERMWCFTMSIRGIKDFRGSVGKIVISYMCPWDDDTFCLLGYSMIIPSGKRVGEMYRELRDNLLDITVKAQKYLGRSKKSKKSGLPEIPQAFQKAFDDL